jgi:hypothetical protein
VRLPDFVIGNGAVGAHQDRGLVAPPAEVFVIQARERRTGPGVWVDAVGHRPHLVTGEHAPRGFRMALGNAVDIFAHVQGQPRHVYVIIAGQVAQCVRIHVVPQNGLHQVMGETVMTGFHGRVSSEIAQFAHPWKIIRQIARAQILLRVGEVLQQIQGQKCRMSFVHVVLAHMKIQGPQQSRAAYSQYDFLLEPVGVVPAI